jgi:hypothetical protein
MKSASLFIRTHCKYPNDILGCLDFNENSEQYFSTESQALFRCVLIQYRTLRSL